MASSGSVIPEPVDPLPAGTLGPEVAAVGPEVAEKGTDRISKEAKSALEKKDSSSSDLNIDVARPKQDIPEDSQLSKSVQKTTQTATPKIVESKTEGLISPDNPQWEMLNDKVDDKLLGFINGDQFLHQT